MQTSGGQCFRQLNCKLPEEVVTSHYRPITSIIQGSEEETSGEGVVFVTSLLQVMHCARCCVHYTMKF